MKKIYEGKTKDVYQLDDGNIGLIFKDDMTGEDGKFDPGANTVGVTVKGAGNAGLRMSSYFFKLLNKQNCPNHFISSDIENNMMTVKPITIFGKGLEVICRFKAVGSFIKRYGSYINDSTPLDKYVEITLKDDEKGDPLITKDALCMLNILTEEEYETLKSLTQKISLIIKDDLSRRGLELYDIKLEFGRDSSGNILLIDEISGGNMRVFKGDKYVMPIELTKLILEDC